MCHSRYEQVWPVRHLEIREVWGSGRTMHSRQKLNVRAVDCLGKVSKVIITDLTSNRLTGAKMNSPEETQVVVTDIQMPFISMVVFMVKWALAANSGIPDTGRHNHGTISPFRRSKYVRCTVLNSDLELSPGCVLQENGTQGCGKTVPRAAG